jgi:hypothetical protein
MNDTIVQSLIWLSAGGLLFLFMRRRRSRRTSQQR